MAAVEGGEAPDDRSLAELNGRILMPAASVAAPTLLLFETTELRSDDQGTPTARSRVRRDDKGRTEEKGDDDEGGATVMFALLLLVL
jgi:hypothetical protein